MTMQSLIWNLCVFGAAFYVVVWQDWDPLTLLFAALITNWGRGFS